GALLKQRRKPFRAHAIAVFGGAPALPHDRVMNRLAGLAIPDDCCLTLIRNADGFDLIRLYTGLSQQHVHGVELRRPNVFGSMLDPSGLRIKLLEFLLRGFDGAAFAVEQDRARTGGALIEREDVLLPHLLSPRWD